MKSPPARPTLNFDFVLASLSAYDEDGFLGVQPDALGEEQSGSPAVPLHHAFGFSSRPLDPDTDGNGQPTIGCEMLLANEGEQGHAFLAQDPRVTAKLPQHKKGGSLQYGATGAFAQFDGETGSWTVYIPYALDGNGVAQKAHSIVADVASGNEMISISHGDGMGLRMFQGSVVVQNNAGDGYVEVNAGGVTVNGNFTVNGGLIAGDPAAAEPLVRFPGLLAYLTVLEAKANAAPGPPIPPTNSILSPTIQALILTTKVSGK